MALAVYKPRDPRKSPLFRLLESLYDDPLKICHRFVTFEADSESSSPVDELIR